MSNELFVAGVLFLTHLGWGLLGYSVGWQARNAEVGEE